MLERKRVFITYATSLASASTSASLFHGLCQIRYETNAKRVLNVPDWWVDVKLNKKSSYRQLDAPIQFIADGSVVRPLVTLTFNDLEIFRM